MRTAVETGRNRAVGSLQSFQGLDLTVRRRLDGLLHGEYGGVRLEKMSRLRQTIARNMVESYTTIPQLTNFDDADVTELEDMREQSKADYADRGIKLTSLPFLIKAVASALSLAHHLLRERRAPAQMGVQVVQTVLLSGFGLALVVGSVVFLAMR